MTAAELLTLIEERAPKLRKAGVLVLELAEVGVKLHLAPEVPDLADDPAAKAAAKKQREASNPLFDATTYGLEPGSKLPGFDPPVDDENAEDEHGRPIGAELDED